MTCSMKLIRTSLAVLLISLIASNFAKAANDEPHENKPDLTDQILFGVLRGAAKITVHGIANECNKPENRNEPNCMAVGNLKGGINNAKESARSAAEDLVYLKSETKELKDNLKKSGELKAKGCAAHHIVPQNDQRAASDNARRILKACKIDINDARNGVYLPYKESAACTGANHSKLHTNRYYNYVAEILLNAMNNNGCESVIDELSSLKNQLRSNYDVWEPK